MIVLSELWPPVHPPRDGCKYEVSVRFVIRLMQRWQATGSARVRGQGGDRVIDWSSGELIDRLLAAKRDTTLEELRQALAREGVKVSARQWTAI